ncbi:MAG: M20 family metallopeptidase [Myxococcota bacterium]
MSDAPCIRHLRDYVAIPSVNPMRRHDLPAEIVGEARYAAHLREQLRRMGLDAELIGDPERPSVVAEARSSAASETVLVASHLDTVPIDGMEIDPFDPRIEGGRLHGRGSCDTKAGMAALIAALERLLPHGRLRCHVIVVGEADEELSSRGARDVLDHLAGRLPDWALATEPTSLRLVTHHRGVAHARLVARGRAAHAADPRAGRNAIYAIAEAVRALRALAERLQEVEDPRLGPATLSVGTIQGGSAANIVPDRAELLLDRRVLPREDPGGVRAELEAALLGARIRDVEIDWCRLEKLPLATAEEQRCVRRCQRALRSCGLPEADEAAVFATDAGLLSHHGIPSVVIGPGSVEQAHTAREWVAIEQVEKMTDLLETLFASGEPRQALSRR